MGKCLLYAGMGFVGMMIFISCTININGDMPVVITDGAFLLMIAGYFLLFRQIWIDEKKNKAIAREKIAKQEEKERKERLSKQNGTWPLPVAQLEKSFKENNVQDMANERDYQKAKLLVEDVLRKEGIPRESYSLYTTREKMAKLLSRTNDVRNAQMREELRQRKAQLRADEAECTYYARFIGREKSIRYCQDQIAYYTDLIEKCKANADSVNKGGGRLYDLSKGRESSWAIHGGIASGIAGGAAGLAVAADIQRKNAQIQQQNENLASAIAQFQVTALQEIWKEQRKAEKELQYWKAGEEVASIKLIQNLDEQYLLSCINPVVISAENDPAGAVIMKVKLKCAPNLCIYENTPACVDGSFRVLLSVRGRTVGNAICVIKYRGVTFDQTEKCICTNVTEQADTYEFSFEPYHLWAVEKN